MPSHHQDGWIDVCYHINDEAGGELINIVGVEDQRVSNKTKVPLQLKCNKHWFLPWKQKEGSESSAVVLHCHEPALDLPIDVGMGHLPVIHKVHLKMIKPVI